MKLTTSLVAFIITGCCVGCSDRAAPEIQDQMVRKAKIATVEASKSYLEFEFVGRVEAVQTVDLSFQVGGPLEKLPVLPGQSINKGQLIAQLEPNDFDLAVREATARLKLASQDLARKKRVLKEKGIAKSSVEDAQTQVQLRQIQLDKTLEALSDTKLKAPFDAYVSRRYLDNYSNVKALEPIVRLHDLSELLIRTSVPELILATSSADQVMELSAEFAFIKDKKFPLQYRESRGEAEASSQTYQVSFAMQNQTQWNILPGMTATVTIRLHAPQQAAAIINLPTSAIVSDAHNQLSVWIYDKDSGKVSRRAIKTGLPINNLIPVTHGLAAGEQVVVAGANQLMEGMRVIPLTRETIQDG